MSGPFRFELLARDATLAARAGRLHTPHGPVETPVFMPVGTRAALKGVPFDTLDDMGCRMVLGNAYHLMQRPGADVIRDMGGLHSFTGWPHAILTDSGGFQVWSLRHRMKMDEDGVTFRSEVNGDVLRLTPESVVRLQEDLGADVAMPLDHCLEYPATAAQARDAVERTVRWARRSVAAKRRDDQALFPIVQGGVYPEIRRECAAALVELDMPGYASGGLSVGERPDEAQACLVATHEVLPEDRPRYLMGVGTPRDFLDAVAVGVDMVDCVLPTRNARHNTALTRTGRVNMRNKKHERDERPLDRACTCLTCRRHSRAYLRHLAQIRSLMAAVLLSIHNVQYMLDLARDTRAALREGHFAAFRAAALARLEAGGDPDA